MDNLWPLEAEESCRSCAVAWEEWFTSENRSFRWFSEYLVVFPEASASTSRVTHWLHSILMIWLLLIRVFISFMWCCRRNWDYHCRYDLHHY